MNCREAEPLLFAARDGALPENQRAALAAHLSSCAACSRARNDLQQLVADWREENAAVRSPDAGFEWRKLQRTLAHPPARRPLTRWIALPVLAGAAAAIALYVAPTNPPASPPISTQTVARAEPTVTPADSSPTTVVYVDDKSGWTFVWSPDTGSDGQHI